MQRIIQIRTAKSVLIFNAVSNLPEWFLAWIVGIFSSSISFLNQPWVVVVGQDSVSCFNEPSQAPEYCVHPCGLSLSAGTGLLACWNSAGLPAKCWPGPLSLLLAVGHLDHASVRVVRLYFNRGIEVIADVNRRRVRSPIRAELDPDSSLRF